MGPSLKSLRSQALGAALALAVLALAAFHTGLPARGGGTGPLLPDPGQACLLPAGGAADIVALALLAPPAAECPGSDRSGPEIRGILQGVMPGGPFLGRVLSHRPAMAYPKRAGLSCGLPLGAHAPPPTA